VTATDLNKLHVAATWADERFQAALEVEYGKRACNKRYSASHDSALVSKLRDQYQAATEAWREAYRAAPPAPAVAVRRRRASR
jgi:hypothetical protein